MYRPKPTASSRDYRSGHGLSKWTPVNPHSTQTTRQPLRSFDSESGVVFSELKTAVAKRQAYDWIGEPRLQGSRRKRAVGDGHGAASLLNLAIHSLASNIRELTADHLYEVPWTLGEKVWQAIIDSGNESFHAWRTFARAYPEQFALPNARYHLTIRDTALPLSDYFHGLGSSPAQWLVSLRISPRYTAYPDLVNIASIRNLVILDLSDEFTIDPPLSHFDERVLRSWTELATQNSSLRHLRVLLLGWQEQISWTYLFKYLRHFPSLTSVIFTDCLHINQRNRLEWEDEAKSHGWIARHAKRSAKNLRPIVGGDTGFHIGAVSDLYYDTQDAFNQSNHDLKPLGMETSLPMLECWIGRPRLWTHIVDEFPAGRTVWFDKVDVAPADATTNAASARIPTAAEPMDIGDSYDNTFNPQQQQQKKSTTTGGKKTQNAKKSYQQSNKRNRNGTRTIEDLLGDLK